MTLTEQIITIGVVILGTMITRFLPFIIFPEGKQPPEFISYLSKVLPSAVIGLLVVYCLRGSPAMPHLGLAQWIAIAFIVVLHVWKQNVLLSIAGGTILYMVLIHFI